MTAHTDACRRVFAFAKGPDTTSEEHDDIMRVIHDLNVHIGYLQEALRPFAEKATAWEGRHPSRRPAGASDSMQITHRLGDFRAARRAVEKKL